MNKGRQFLTNARYYGSVSIIYLLTLLFAFYAFSPIVKAHKTDSVILTKAVQKPFSPAPPPSQQLIAGRPVRIVMPGSNIDLPIDPGYYNSADGSWTLSGYRAQFAMISTLANNSSGDTFIYGHNNNYVFGALRHNTPASGAQALLYTDNGRIFKYSFQRSFSLSPSDTSVLTYSGAPIMTIQTCTGSLNEWRTMYRFNYVGVVQ